ncbi:uncharacterized protein LOC142168244 [Nicotiana tabacum]|uniref:Uncharacterized protein LOC142168244 n=1 Tax=Nicotiana tabacum TaxID=4097 RepID=A0AC58SJ58_TOBAC
MLNGNRSAANGMALYYIIPELVEVNLVAKLEKLDLEAETMKWKYALIIYVIGEKPRYNYIHRYINQMWNTVTMPELYSHDDGYFMVRFHSMTDMKKLLCDGPYIVNNRPMIMKQWSPQFDFDAEFLTEIPLWVRFPKLPMNCWGGSSLSRIASIIGILLFADECTANQTRILIEVNVTKPLPNKVLIMDDLGRIFDHIVEYDWKHDFCGKCLKIGHDCTKTSKEEVKQDKQPPKKRPQPMKQIWRSTGVMLTPP